MAEKIQLLFRKFDGGWNTEDASDDLKPNESPDLVNVEYKKGGSIRKANGFVELGEDDEDLTIAPNGLVKAPNRNGIDWLLKFAGEKLKIYDPEEEEWNIIKVGLTAGEKWGDDTFSNVTILVSQVDDALSMDLSKITRLNGDVSLGATSIIVDDGTVLDASGSIYLNDALITYSGKSGNTLTGCSGVVASDDNQLVTQALETHAGIPKGNMCINFGGRLIVAGATGSGGATIYGSKATDRTDFTVAGGAAANDALLEALASEIKAIRVFLNDDSEERIIAFLSNNELHTINVTDDATLGTLVFQNFYKSAVTALNHFATIVGENNIYYPDLNNQIKSLAPRTDDGSGRNFSNSISTKHRSLFRDEYNFDDSAADILDNEYWCIAKEDSETLNDRIIIYDEIRKAWRKRTGIVAKDIINFNNKITIASAVQNKVFQITPNELSDDGKAMLFRYSFPDINLNPLVFERVRHIRFAGVMSENCIATVKVYRDFGSILLGEFTIRGDNSKIVLAEDEKEGSFGSVSFGGIPFGGEEASDRKYFFAHLELKELPDTENLRIVVENNQAGVYLELSKLRPAILEGKEDFLPEDYIIDSN